LGPQPIIFPSQDWGSRSTLKFPIYFRLFIKKTPWLSSFRHLRSRMPLGDRRLSKCCSEQNRKHQRSNLFCSLSVYGYVVQPMDVIADPEGSAISCFPFFFPYLSSYLLQGHAKRPQLSNAMASTGLELSMLTLIIWDSLLFKANPRRL
jgi:hypothetical protein